MKHPSFATTFAFASTALAFLGTSALLPAHAAADEPIVRRSDVDDTHLVAMDVGATRIHLGDAPGPLGAAAEIASSSCEDIANDGVSEEFDCSAAVSSALAAADPTLAGAPLIYPAMQKGYHKDGGQPASFGSWELYLRPIRVRVATKAAAATAASFRGVGFYRMGYEFSASLMWERYTSARAKQFSATTYDTQQLVPVAALKEVPAEARDARADGAPVVVHEFVFLLAEAVHEPWLTPTGWAWLPGSDGTLKPFAQFEADGVVYRNYDVGGVDYRTPSFVRDVPQN